MSETSLSPIEEIIEEARNGRMFILVDDEDRENEGDLVIPAQMATPEAINFMAMHGRGLICLSLENKRCDQLGLDMMSASNQSRHQTAFTVSIEAREGVSTGISAHDRARSIAVALHSDSGPEDIATPGHVFPLRAQEGGVLVRAGHTEAAVDIARLAGLHPSGVICEIMKDDGSMARLPDLLPFAEKHGLKIAQIADLIRYRRRHDRIVERRGHTTINSIHGGAFDLYLYVNKAHYAEHIALVKGDVTAEEPVPVRVHSLNVLEDVLGDRQLGRGGELTGAMEMIAGMERGVVVIIREPRATSLSGQIGRLVQVAGGQAPDTPDLAGDGSGNLRQYGIGAQILHDLGVRDMILLTNKKKHIVGLDGFGLNLVEQRPIRF